VHSAFLTSLTNLPLYLVLMNLFVFEIINLTPMDDYGNHDNCKDSIFQEIYKFYNCYGACIWNLKICFLVKLTLNLKLTSLSKMNTIIVFGTRWHEEEACEGSSLSLLALVKVCLIFNWSPMIFMISIFPFKS
jgi:hypothetical protein